MLPPAPVLLLACPALLAALPRLPAPPQEAARAAEVVNGGFEYGGFDTVPAGWQVHPPEEDGAHHVATTTERPFEGTRCGTLASPFADGASGQTYLYQMVDAQALAGRRVRARAALRCSGGPPFGAAHLWLRATGGADDEPAADLGERAVRADEWTAVELVLDVPPDAAWVQVGLRLDGFGRAWIDGVELEAIGAAGEGIEGPRPLVGPALENLVAFARLYGYVRWFHPSDEAAAADWNEIARRGAAAVEGAEDAAQLERALEELFAPLTTDLSVGAEGEPLGPLVPVDGAALSLTAWEHRGVGPEDGVLYRSRRVRVPAASAERPAGFPDPAQPLTAPLTRGLTCRLALVVAADEGGTMPRGRRGTPASVTVLAPATGDDRTTRLADVVMVWNVLRHFYPYSDLVDVGWDAALQEALSAAAVDEGRVAFVETLERLVARLEDGHARVDLAGLERRHSPPLALEWIEDALLVTAVGENAEGITVGDVVTALDGVPAAEAMAAAERLSSGATPAARRRAAVRRLLLGERGSALAVQVGGARRVLLRTELGLHPPDRPPPVDEPAPGLFYVDLDRIDRAGFEDVLYTLADARGVVFDLRGYPADMPYFVASFLTDETLESPRWLIPRVTRPHPASPEWDESSWPLQPLEPLIAANVVFVTDASAQSASETYLSFIEHYQLAPIVGEPTAGTNGNVNNVSLPGGYRVSFTGMRVLKQDGSQHHGVGIQPTHPVERTRRGVSEGRDEALELARALALEGRDTPADLAAWWLTSGSYEEAAAAYAEALGEDPRDPTLLQGRAEALLLAGRLDDALAGYDALLAVDASHRSARQGRGFILWTQGALDEARAELDRGVREWPDEPESYLNRGHLFYTARQWAEARADFARMGELTPDDRGEAPLYVWLADRRLGNDAEEANTRLRAELEADVDSFFGDVARFLLGELDEDELLETAERDWGELALYLARFYAAEARDLAGDDEGAARLWRECVDPEWRMLHEYWTANAALTR